LFLPTTIKEVRERGWDQLDVILFSGDAYIDHPAFGAAVVGRLLEAEGYRVAIVPQPNWRDDLRDFRKLGAPRLFFGISGGSMDSMVNHYTANLRLRHDDAYTPGGKAGFRPDRAVTVYSQILKRLYPHVPVVIGGIEASLRRLTHYDYWSDALKPSILAESGADLLIYGMGERVVQQVARAMRNGYNAKLLRKIRQVAFLSDESYVARLDPAGEIGGVTYINDSKATNVDSTWYALESMKRPVVWIAGGTDKGNDYEPLKRFAREKVHTLVCMGIDNRKLVESFTGIIPEIISTDSLDAAMQAARKASRPGDVVLLSPACASFDLFKNYENRGELFKQWVAEHAK